MRNCVVNDTFVELTTSLLKDLDETAVQEQHFSKCMLKRICGPFSSTGCTRHLHSASTLSAAIAAPIVNFNLSCTVKFILQTLQCTILHFISFSILLPLNGHVTIKQLSLAGVHQKVKKIIDHCLRTLFMIFYQRLTSQNGRLQS
jgi:hypothetical protein